MHILLSLLGTTITVLVLLSKLADAGISLGGLNPFLWKHSRQWEKEVTGNPIYNISDPMDASALLMTAAARIDGDMTNTDKSIILSAFEEKFGLSKKEAAGLLLSSMYLLGKCDGITARLDKIIKPSLMNFTKSQSQSAISLLESLCEANLEASDLRQEFVAQASQLLKSPFQPQEKWGDSDKD